MRENTIIKTKQILIKTSHAATGAIAEIRVAGGSLTLFELDALASFIKKEKKRTMGNLSDLLSAAGEAI